MAAARVAYSDRGKSAVLWERVERWTAKPSVGLLDKVTKDWTRQRKQELKDQQMPPSHLKASAQGTLPAHARQIMYAARGYIQSKTWRNVERREPLKTCCPAT
ncbi:MAG: hypothetical protein R3F44_17225 [Candidatus Competibacteraceae bacterium]